ncbi:MAG: ABC transporter ATP-binding protein [Hyphomicrobiaceae bacterium]|nr:ABC transporter ATP-binding protein [Hyphomicrobiaceae bacterium]
MLILDHVSKTWPSGTEALRGIDLDVQEGEILAIVGGSGCGKTTLLRCIAGLETPSRGRVVVDGDVIDSPHPAVGFVFQEPRLLPWLTVAGNIGFGIADLPKAERTARIDRMLALIGLSGYGGRWPKELSGGQAQRVAIARALIAKPQVILFDEPFSALDAVTRRQLHALVRRLRKETGTTMIIVTHDVDEAVALGDRIAVLQPHPGRVYRLLDGPGAKGGAPEAVRQRLVTALDGSLAEGSARSDAASSSAGLWW